MNASFDNLTMAAGEDDLISAIVRSLEDSGGGDMLTQVREAVTQEARLLLAQDERGWTKLGLESCDYDFPAGLRRERIEACRLGAKTNPLLVQAHRLWCNFSIGGGVTVNTDLSNRETVLFLPEFWGNPLNSEVLSPKGQVNSAFRLLTDGDMFFALVRRGTDIPLVRRIQALEMTAIVSDEDDADDVLGYVREFKSVSGGDKKIYFYPHWSHEDLQGTPQEVGNYLNCGSEKYNVKDVKFQADKFIHHISFEPLGRWGNPLAASVLGLTQAHLKFIQSRLTIVQAIAAFVRKLIVKGGPDAVNAIKNQLQSSLAASSGVARETNPGPAAGSTLVANAGTQYENMKMDTGSESAQTDGMMLVTMIGTGLGIFPHYFGQGESFRLATATAMEPPMMKMFQAYQKSWEQLYKGLTEQALSWKKIPKKKRYVRMDFPEISPRNMSALLESMALMFKAAPGFLQIPDVPKIIMALMGVDDPQAAVELMKKENLDLRPASERVPAAVVGDDPGEPEGDDPGTPDDKPSVKPVVKPSPSTKPPES